MYMYSQSVINLVSLDQQHISQLYSNPQRLLSHHTTQIHHAMKASKFIPSYNDSAINPCSSAHISPLHQLSVHFSVQIKYQRKIFNIQSSTIAKYLQPAFQGHMFPVNPLLFKLLIWCYTIT